MNLFNCLVTNVLLVSSIFLLIYILVKRIHIRVPSVKYLCFFIITIILFDIFYIISCNLTDKNIFLLLLYLSFIVTIMGTCFLANMALQYVRRVKKERKIIQLIGIFYIVFYVILLSFDLLHFNFCIHEINWEMMQNPNLNSIFIANIGYGLKLIAILELLRLILIRALYLYEYYAMTNKQKKKCAIVYLIFLLQTPSWIYIFISPNMKIYAYIFIIQNIITNIIIILGIFKFRIFENSYLTLNFDFRLDCTNEAFLIFDYNGQATDCNENFENLYHINLSNLTLDKFINEHIEFRGIQDRHIEYIININGKEKCYYAQLKRLFSGKILVGNAIIIDDITMYIEKYKEMANIANNKAEVNEISFLRAQIKPHFLNNTLSIISSTISYNPQLAKNLICDLGDFLRGSYFFDNSTDFVSLKDEIEIINTFIRIERTRFGDRLNFELEYDPTLNIKIPRLSIQTLVENSIKHGILKKAVGGNVCLKITKLEEKILIEVIDDGVGIESKKISELLLKDNKKSGIGLYNTNLRLNKYYNESLNIKSELGKGTTVSFYIPYDAGDLIENFVEF